MTMIAADILKEALDKYGEQEAICIASEYLKHWDQCTCFDTVDIDEVSHYTIRNALLGLGHIVEEDLERQIYMTTVRVGHFGAEAMLITHMIDKTVEIAAYAKEGIIKQHIAQKAVELVKARLNA